MSIKDDGCSADDGYTNYETYALLFVQKKPPLAQPLSVNNSGPTGTAHWIDIQINGSILIHGNTGWETNTTTVTCLSNCGTGNGASTVGCNANSNNNDPNTCNDDTSYTDYQDDYDAPFTGGDGTTGYPFNIAISVNAPASPATDSAYIYSLGTHITP